MRLEVREADTFIRLHFSNAESLDVTPHHIFTLADGSPMRAERLCLSDVFVGRFGRVTLKRIEVVTESGTDLSSAGVSPANLRNGVSSPEFALWRKVTVSCEPSHQFFAGRHSANVLTHNYRFSS